MRLLIFELWGLGDLTFVTSLLQRCREENLEVMLLGKPHSGDLLKSSFPEVKFLSFVAPWTAYRGKYQFLSWPWDELIRVTRLMMEWNPDIAVSVRPDPRDHLWMKLVNTRRQVGVVRPGYPNFLTDPLVPAPLSHRVENWWQIEAAIFGESRRYAPFLNRPSSVTPRSGKSSFLLHLGARIPVRRWPVAYYRNILERMRGRFHLTLVPDLDGYGKDLADLADETIMISSISELMGRISAADLFMGNDSGPAHIAASFGIPSITFFGPTQKEWFRPFGDRHLVVQRDLCPHRPCFDYCRFAEPYCLTHLRPDDVWPEIAEYLEKRIAPL